MLLSEVVSRYVSARKGVVSAETVIWYENKLKRLVRILGDPLVTDVTLEDLERARACLLDTGVTAQTVDGHIRAYRTFFKWCHEHHKVTKVKENAAAELKRPKVPDVPPKRISKESVVLLLRSAMGAGRVDLSRDHGFEDVRDYALVRFFVMTGARRGGVHGLKLGDVNLGDSSARVHEKGNKSRIVYYDPDTAAALQEYLEARPILSHDWLWVTKKGRHLTVNGIRQIIRRVCERAGLPDIGAHRLRHTFAFESVEAGADPDQLREQLGHNHLSTTYNSYVRWTDEERKRTFNKSWLGDLKATENRPKLRVVKKAK